MRMKKGTKWKAGIIAMAVTIALGASSVVTYATGYGTDSKQTIPAEGDYVDEDGNYIQFEMSLEELGLTEDDIIIPVGTADNASTRSANGHIDAWSIPSNKTAKAGSFKKNVNDTISLCVTIIPTNKTAQAGIILPNGNAVCIQGTGTLSGTFTCPSTGYYWVYVRNLSDTTVIANGSYTY